MSTALSNVTIKTSEGTVHHLPMSVAERLSANMGFEFDEFNVRGEPLDLNITDKQYNSYLIVITNYNDDTLRIKPFTSNIYPESSQTVIYDASRYIAHVGEHPTFDNERLYFADAIHAANVLSDTESVEWMTYHLAGILYLYCTSDLSIVVNPDDLPLWMKWYHQMYYESPLMLKNIILNMPVSLDEIRLDTRMEINLMTDNILVVNIMTMLIPLMFIGFYEWQTVASMIDCLKCFGHVDVLDNPITYINIAYTNVSDKSSEPRTEAKLLKFAWAGVYSVVLMIAEILDKDGKLSQGLINNILTIAIIGMTADNTPRSKVNNFKRIAHLMYVKYGGRHDSLLDNPSDCKMKPYEFSVGGLFTIAWDIGFTQQLERNENTLQLLKFAESDMGNYHIIEHVCPEMKD